MHRPRHPFGDEFAQLNGPLRDQSELPPRQPSQTWRIEHGTRYNNRAGLPQEPFGEL